MWYDANSGNTTHPAGQKKPNGYGLYDMSGNVWEWCSDWYGENYYQNSPKNNPQGPDSGQERVLSGGSWNIYPEYGLCVTNRSCYYSVNGYGNFGFRCAVSLK